MNKILIRLINDLELKCKVNFRFEIFETYAILKMNKSLYCLMAKDMDEGLMIQLSCMVFHDTPMYSNNNTINEIFGSLTNLIKYIEIIEYANDNTQ